jgi:hypothetical protein
MRIAFFTILLASVVVLAWQRGRNDEQLAALTCVAGAILTVVGAPAYPIRFAQFHLPHFLVDLGVLASFTFIALRSTRFWPMWVAGLQLVATSVHLLKLLSPALMGLVFGAALAFWSYPILLIIAVGAWRTHLIERWRAAHDIASQRAIT